MIKPIIYLLPSWWTFKIVYILMGIYFFYMPVLVPEFLSRGYLDWAFWEKGTGNLQLPKALLKQLDSKLSRIGEIRREHKNILMTHLTIF